MLFGLSDLSTAQQAEIDYTGLCKREERTVRRLYRDYVYKYGKPGYFIQPSVDAFCHTLDKYNLHDGMYGINTVHGYSFCPYLDLGGGLGFYCLTRHSKTVPYYAVPLFAYIRVNLINLRCTPYLAARVGAAYSWDGDRNREHGCMVTEGVAPYINGECGFKFYLRDGSAIYAGFTIALIPFSNFGIGPTIGFTW